VPHLILLPVELSASFPPFADLQNSGQGDHGDDRSADRDASAPPLGVKLTVYRLLNMTILLSIGITKGILTYKGEFTAPTTLDWVGGALLAAV
jgi:hypothetical protein